MTSTVRPVKNTPAADQPLGARVLMGAKIGVALAIVTAVFAGVLILLSGLQAFHARYGSLSVAGLMVTYLSLGLVGGVLWGAMLPLTRGWIGTVFVGVVIGGIAGMGFCTASFGPSFWRQWGPLQIVELTVFGVTGGLTACVMKRRMAQIRARQKHDRLAG
jgi:hypothetical protein